jgi:U5 small nuclear ribonucleoprotein component
MFVCDSHKDKFSLHKELKYTDSREDEVIRGLSIKAMPLSLILQNSSDKSYLFNVMDTPGHPNFSDEISAGMRLADGIVIVVDIMEGICTHTEKIIKQAIIESLDIILCINKIDRLILELKLTPADAYFKIKFIIDEFNLNIEKNIPFFTIKKPKFVSPDLKNVIFSSSMYGIIFTLDSFARKYNELHNNCKFDYKTFSKMLWGDLYFDKKTRKFVKKPNENAQNRSFIEFILDPLYKLIGYTISEEKQKLEGLLTSLNIFIKNSEYKLDPKPLLKLICSKFFGHVSAFVDSVYDCVVNSKEGSLIKVEQNYKGDRSKSVYSKIVNCNSNDILAVNVVKLYHKYDYLSFDSFARVLSGTIKKGDIVKIMGENYNFVEQEDMFVKEVTNM